MTYIKLILTKEDLKKRKNYEIELPVKIKLTKSDVKQIIEQKRLYWIVDDCIKIELNQPKTETHIDTVNDTVKGCGKMFQPFLSSDEFYNDEETFWKCGDLWNEKPLLCPDCEEKENSNAK